MKQVLGVGCWVLGVIAVPPMLAAQDTTLSGVRIGITYAPGTRPTLSVVPFSSPALEPISTTLANDLEQSDRFEMVPAPSTARDQYSGILDLRPFTALGTAFVVTFVAGGADNVTVAIMDTRTGQAAQLRVTEAGSTRIAVHRAADEIIRAITGQPGIAATRVLFVRNGRIMRVDADGATPELLRSAGWPSLSRGLASRRAALRLYRLRAQRPAHRGAESLRRAEPGAGNGGWSQHHAGVLARWSQAGLGARYRSGDGYLPF